MPASGYFIIADITGYTAFLTQSELEHAEDILDSLFKAQMEQFKLPFVVNSFRGDAIVAYMLDGAMVQGQTLLEALEEIYYAFTDLRERMRQNTTCTCNACRNIPALDLKLFVHHGKFLLQKIGDREEMLGADVIVVHRMLKSRVREETGITAYSLITEAAVNAMSMSALCKGMVTYSDTYEHIGEIKMFVHDLARAYRRIKEAQRVEVTAEEAHLSFESQLPVPPPLAWDYMTNTQLKKIWLDMLAVERVDDLGGRVREGSAFHCAHSQADMRYSIADWRPFEYFTADALGIMGAHYYVTYRLAPSQGGTKFTWLWKFLDDKREQVQPLYAEAAIACMARLVQLIRDDLTDGKISVTADLDDFEQPEGVNS